ncbi:hypothetical protein HS7_10530 [Sulfolobales archaeon HS-7]|nr:hypothetical protein HS7_10530 [Sulfolobales archaeon HS-7]
MTEAGITAVSELITAYVKSLIEKSKEGKKLSDQEYLILVTYYTENRMDEIRGEMRSFMDYVNKRFEDTNRRIDDLRKDMDTRFEDTNRRIDDLRKDMDTRFEDTNRRIDDLRKDINMLIQVLRK